jgi:hypothetical protein
MTRVLRSPGSEPSPSPRGVSRPPGTEGVVVTVAPVALMLTVPPPGPPPCDTRRRCHCLDVQCAHLPPCQLSRGLQTQRKEPPARSPDTPERPCASFRSVLGSDSEAAACQNAERCPGPRAGRLLAQARLGTAAAARHYDTPGPMTSMHWHAAKYRRDRRPETSHVGVHHQRRGRSIARLPGARPAARSRTGPLSISWHSRAVL